MQPRLRHRRRTPMARTDQAVETPTRTSPSGTGAPARWKPSKRRWNRGALALRTGSCRSWALVLLGLMPWAPSRDQWRLGITRDYQVVIITCVHYLGPPGPSPSQILGTFSRSSEGSLQGGSPRVREDPLGTPPLSLPRKSQRTSRRSRESGK